MRTARVLLVKIVLTLGAAYLAAYLAGGIIWTLIIALTLFAAPANYVLADLIMLPAVGSKAASLVDGGVAALLGFFMLARDPSLHLHTLRFVLVFGLIVTLCEYFFHFYLQSAGRITTSGK
ncbi:MAG: DUF2512 family protein [Dethiobacteraceae bacterium]|nr:DUF2512 family protein [Bacillota bacterium]